MIVTSRAHPLPVGRVWYPPKPLGNRRVVIQHPVHGEYRGPVFVVREVTRDEYCGWLEQETGEALSSTERASLSSYYIYEISID